MPTKQHTSRSGTCLILSLFGLLTLAASNSLAQAKPGASLYGPPVLTDSGPSIRVALSRPAYWIEADPATGAPQMPTGICATAEALHWPAGIVPPFRFTWRVYLDWDFPACPTHHPINGKSFDQPSPLKIDLTHEIRGGQLTVVARTILNGREVCGQAHTWVLGRNPSRQAMLRAFPRDRFGLIASKIGMAESGLRQFGADGLPVVSRSMDVGMMQLNAPSGAVTCADEVWDWRANLRRGLQMLAGKRATTVLASRHAVSLRRIPDAVAYQLACLNVVRSLVCLAPLNAPSVMPLSAAPGSGMLPGEPDPDHLALNQVERETIRRYNGGREYGYQILPDPVLLTIREAGWQIDPGRGGMPTSKGDPAYVLHVLRSRSGLTLATPRPARSILALRHGRRHRRRHGHKSARVAAGG